MTCEGLDHLQLALADCITGATVQALLKRTDLLGCDKATFNREVYDYIKAVWKCCVKDGCLVDFLVAALLLGSLQPGNSGRNQSTEAVVSGFAGHLTNTADLVARLVDRIVLYGRVGSCSQATQLFFCTRREAAKDHQQGEVSLGHSGNSQRAAGSQVEAGEAGPSGATVQREAAIGSRPDLAASTGDGVWSADMEKMLLRAFHRQISLKLTPDVDLVAAIGEAAASCRCEGEPQSRWTAEQVEQLTSDVGKCVRIQEPELQGFKVALGQLAKETDGAVLLVSLRRALQGASSSLRAPGLLDTMRAIAEQSPSYEEMADCRKYSVVLSGLGPQSACSVLMASADEVACAGLGDIMQLLRTKSPVELADADSQFLNANASAYSVLHHAQPLFPLGAMKLGSLAATFAAVHKMDKTICKLQKDRAHYKSLLDASSVKFAAQEETLLGQNDRLSAESSRLRTEVDDRTAQIAELQGKVAKLEAENTNLKAERDRLNARAMAHQACVDVIRSSCDAFEQGRAPSPSAARKRPASKSGDLAEQQSSSEDEAALPEGAPR